MIGVAKAGVSRRGLLRALGIGAAGAGIGAATATGLERSGAAAAGAAPDRVEQFHGAHQAGITTAAQDRLHFAAFDLADGTTRADLIALLQDWTGAAARMTAGTGAGGTPVSQGVAAAPPDDTGEALGLSPAGLTITFGFGPSLFRTADGKDRFGLAVKRPAALVELPRFAGEQLVPAASDGDLCVQACSDDPQVAVHAIRNLSRIAFGRAELRWSQLGFGRTSSTTRGQATARNLFGFKDGTANLKAEDASDVARSVWVGDEGGWMAGGSYLTVRKIRMRIETWDHQSLTEQEQTIGRTKGEGAPLTGGTEHTALDLRAGTAAGPVIPAGAHVRLAHPSANGGAQLLRRGYNFVDGNDDLGRLNAGLFFLAYQRDPRRQFIPIQERLAASDRLNEYVVHVGSGIFAVPPGAERGSYVGAPLFA
ncbi:iron uptake transporter deferrochelatase/peroxidase subunit [Amnibacterium sp. CER49]|uniref:iron uptake transporter deferrochelatase/peroxidase subunit n=1 Tax=Amnibacterium sp. CER49 TaxID=3039161 RepID=UPI00244BFBBF|nr:iron uptake transporter deferrochelatase/peroxidase subunit [Amnibacterium sp. CER49]MDH2445339.1 iron uptake transporter deferrochelatase/peroxidase subunit [Amnibacterium sp. CER49]